VLYFFIAVIFLFYFKPAGLEIRAMGLFDKFKKGQTVSVDDAAKALSGRILKVSAGNAETVKKFYEEQTNGELEIDAWKLWKIVFEFEFLFLHVSDRMSFDILGQDRRSVFLDRLVELTVNSTIDTAFPELGSEERGNLKGSMLTDYNASQYEYGQYRMFANKKESTKDTVFWEFGKKVAERIGQPMNILYITLSMDLAIASLEVLHLNSILQSID